MSILESFGDDEMLEHAPKKYGVILFKTKIATHTPSLFWITDDNWNIIKTGQAYTSGGEHTIIFDNLIKKYNLNPNHKQITTGDRNLSKEVNINNAIEIAKTRESVRKELAERKNNGINFEMTDDEIQNLINDAK